jgi:hypothetical protein
MTRHGLPLEVDAIVTDGGGRWGACEIKVGRGYVDEAATTLREQAPPEPSERPVDERRDHGIEFQHTSILIL